MDTQPEAAGLASSVVGRKNRRSLECSRRGGVGVWADSGVAGYTSSLPSLPLDSDGSANIRLPLLRHLTEPLHPLTTSSQSYEGGVIVEQCVSFIYLYFIKI